MAARPVLGLVAAPGTAVRAVPLLGLLGRHAEVVSWQRRGEARPDALVVTTTAWLGSLAADPDASRLPIAVWAEHHDEVDDAARAGAVVLTSDEGLVERGALLVPAVGIEVGRWRPVAPLVRQRHRQRHPELPEVLVVEGAVEPGEGERRLAAAAACVISGPAVLLALAMGTPVVTSAQTARRLGLVAGREVEVAGGAAAARSLAEEVAADPERAARLSRRARRCAERRFDLAAPAAEVARRLGLVPDPTPASGRIEQRLAELATPPGAPLRHRWEAALAGLDGHPQGSIP